MQAEPEAGASGQFRPSWSALLAPWFVAAAAAALVLWL
jgi:hypothetical protein